MDKVIFTSGEPTLNPDLNLLIQKAKSFQYSQISLTTNGRMLAYKQYAEQLINSGLNEIIVSIHGHNAKTHESLTRTKGSFDQTLNGIKNISDLRKKFNVKLIIAVTLNKKNYLYFENVVSSFFKFDISEITFNIVQPLGTFMEKHFNSLMPRYSDVAIIIEDFYKKNKTIFYQKRKNCYYRVISIIDLPFCQSKILSEYMGYGEKRVVEDIKKEDNKFINELDTIIFNDNKDLKIKQDACNLCKYDSACNGIYINYIKRFGWKEFRPVIDSPR